MFQKWRRYVLRFSSYLLAAHAGFSPESARFIFNNFSLLSSTNWQGSYFDYSKILHATWEKKYVSEFINKMLSPLKGFFRE